MSKKIKGTLAVNVDQCKGCQLCVLACPPGVLKMSKETNIVGYRYPKLLPGCTACKACQIVCPDFVIDVYKFDVPTALEEMTQTGNAVEAVEGVN